MTKTTQKLRTKKLAQFPLYFLLFFLSVSSGCSRYIAYKTKVRDPQGAYDKMVKCWTPGREYVLSYNDSIYRLQDVTFDTMEVKAVIASSKNSPLQYVPDPGMRPRTGKKVIQYNHKADSSALLNQVFVVSDNIVRNGDTLTISMASIKRIDVVKKGYVLAGLFIVLGAVVLFFLIMGIALGSMRIGLSFGGGH